MTTIQEFALMGAKARWKGKTKKQRKEIMAKVTEARLKKLSTCKNKRACTNKKKKI